MSIEEQMRQDVQREEDGRGGFNYETRGTGVPAKYIRNNFPKCVWCGKGMGGKSPPGMDYHEECLELKQRLERKHL